MTPREAIKRLDRQSEPIIWSVSRESWLAGMLWLVMLEVLIAVVVILGLRFVL